MSLKCGHNNDIICKINPCSTYSRAVSPQGGENMKKYEAMLIFVPELEEEKRNSLLDRLKGIIEADGTISNVDDWGSRKLAYEINDYTDGYYVVINFESTPEAVKEFDRIAKISDSLLRHMVVREEE